MSIFQKDCPECAAPNSANATTCRCGYRFDGQAASDDDSAYARQQDRLYCDYLAARIAQAEAELLVARELAKADPENAYKASGALLAEQALNALQAEMRQLSLRISAWQRRSHHAPVRPKPTITKPAPVAKPAPQVTPKPVTAKREATPNTQPMPRSAPAQHQPPKQESQRPKAVGGIRRKAPAASPVSAPAPTATVREVRAAPSAPIPQPSAKPNETFRRAQAQKADAIARSKMPTARREPALPARVATKPTPPRPSADIPPLVLKSAATTNAGTQDCPNCTARVAADAQRCGCGYAFARASEQVPALTLDATALSILTEGISSLNPNRRR